MACRIKTIRKTRVASDVMKISPKVGEIIRVGRDLLFLPVDFLQFLSFVKRRFNLSGFQSKGCVPRTPDR